MSNDFTTDAREEYKKAYNDGWNNAIKTVFSGLAIEYRSDSELDKYTIEVVLGLLQGLEEDELYITSKEFAGVHHETPED